MKKFALLVILALLAYITPAHADQPIHVVASFSILGDMVQQIGGDAITLHTIVGPDTDTHTYQPTPDDAKALATADLIFINGLGFESWMKRLIHASGTKAKIITVSTGVTPRMIGKTPDPHAWQNLANGRIYVKNIADALAKASPTQENAIRTRAANYDTAIAQMDDFVRQDLALIPPTQRKIITSHDAFGYFGDAYGITFLSPLGMSTDEASPAALDVAKLIDQIKTEHVKEVFIENMSDPKLIKQIAHDSGAQMGGELYSDALSAEGPTAHYLGLFRNNVPQLKAAMLGLGK